MVTTLMTMTPPQKQKQAQPQQKHLHPHLNQVSSGKNVLFNGDANNLTTLAELAATVLLGLSWACWKMQVLDCRSRGCFADQQQQSEMTCLHNAEECALLQSEWVWSYLLIATHLLSFALLPLTMYVVWTRWPSLLHQQADSQQKSMNLGLLQMGLASMCISMAFEVGHHIQSSWYYRNGYGALNYLFYLFLSGGFCLWAEGFYSHFKSRRILGTALLFCAASYPLGAVRYFEHGEKAGTYKIAVYVALTLPFILVTTRGMKVLQDGRMGWVPFFSVGVNLFFVALLQKADPAGGPLTKWNYIWHILHDILGTEMGLAVFAYLVWDNPSLHRRRGALQLEKQPSKAKSVKKSL